MRAASIKIKISPFFSSLPLQTLAINLDFVDRQTQTQQKKIGHLLDSKQLSESTRIQVSGDTRARLSRLMHSHSPKHDSAPSTSHDTAHLRPAPATQTPTPPQSSSHSLHQALAPLHASLNQSGFTHPVPQFLTHFLTLVAKIRIELEVGVAKMLQLNHGRREGIAQYLDRLAGMPPGPSTALGNADAAGGLRRWVDALRTPAQNQALQMYFEEVAAFVLGQAILLKAWSDRGIRPLKSEDLAGLNWALSTALKTYVPLDRDGWQITRQNLYSWYNPSLAIQKEILATLELWRIRDEDPTILSQILRLARPTQPPWPELKSYDARFFSLLWQQMPQFGIDPTTETGPLKRKKLIFSPTLRDGTMVRTCPPTVNWIGLESNTFLLFVSELVQLWRGPSAPQLWSLGTGLEVHTRDQLTLALGSPKPSLQNRIAEIESCDIAYVLEERVIRSNSRSPESSAFREQSDTLTYYKKLRAPGTSLGDLQACVALSKLRPGGLLWWAREEPITAADGQEMLGFILDRAKLVYEWNLSDVQHSLPSASMPFPKHLYLFEREPDVSTRVAHRPTRLIVQGQVRSHVEVPLILSDALMAALNGVGGSSIARANWQVHVQVSPTTQKDWSEHWPDPASNDTLRALEELRLHSAPLASVTTIRHTPQGDPLNDGKWTIPSLLSKGFWIYSDLKNEGRRLCTEALPRIGSEMRGSGFLVLVPDEAWIAPLRVYLENETVRQWLEFNADRKGDRWMLSEQVVKYIPLPHALLDALETGHSTPLPSEWERISSEIAVQPDWVLNQLQRLDHLSLTDAAEAERIRTQLFVRSSRTFFDMRESQSKLLAMVTKDGRIHWKELLDILPKGECSPVTLSDLVQMMGTLPLHLPIGRMDRVKSPTPGIALATESGFQMTLVSHTPRILEILWDQLNGIQHPTWSELSQYLRVPRRLDYLEATASEILQAHGAQTQLLQDLETLVQSCLSF